MSLTVHDKRNDQNSICYYTLSHGVMGFLRLMLLLFRPTFCGYVRAVRLYGLLQQCWLLFSGDLEGLVMPLRASGSSQQLFPGIRVCGGFMQELEEKSTAGAKEKDLIIVCANTCAQCM